MPTIASEFVIFVEEPPDISVKDGIVHIADRSGNLVFKRVMPVKTFLCSLRQASRLMAAYEASTFAREIADEEGDQVRH